MSSVSSATLRKPIEIRIVSAERHASGADNLAPTVGSHAALDGVLTDGRDADASLPANPHYESMGGAPAVRALVDRLYDHMGTLPDARRIRALHPSDLTPVKETLFRFLSGWLGGPQLYAKSREKPRLRRSHLAFPIGDAERDAWMDCMTRALDDVVVDLQLRTELRQAFFKTAHFLRNR